MPDEVFLTPEQIAERLQVRPYTVREWLRTGKLKGIRVAGRIWRVRPEAFEEFLAVGAASAAGTAKDKEEGTPGTGGGTS